MYNLRRQSHHPPRIPPLTPRRPTLIIRLYRQQGQKRTLLLPIPPIHTNNQLTIIIRGIELFEHF